MGYTTEFSGSVEIVPPLNKHEISFLRDFQQTRRMHRTGGPLFVGGSNMRGQGHDDDVLDYNKPDPDQPGLWCQWEAGYDGSFIEWDGNEKFYHAAEWMEYIVNKLLSPAARPYVDAHLKEDERLKHFTCDHVVSGEIYADGEDGDDHWLLVVDNNKVEVHDGHLTYGQQQDTGPAAAEVAAAIKSIGGRPKVKVWTLVTDTDEVVVQVFGTEQECYDSLRENFAPEGFDGDDGALVEELTERQRVALYIEEHEVEVML